MGDNGHFDDVFECEVKRVPAAKAVTGRAEFRDALLLERSNNFIEDRARLLRSVVREPCIEVELLVKYINGD